MANLINLKEFDKSLAEADKYLDRLGRAVSMLNLDRFEGRVKANDLVHPLVQTYEALASLHDCFVQLAHNNRDGRG